MHILILCPPQNIMFKPIADACCQSLALKHKVRCATEWQDGYDIALFIAFHHLWKIPKKTSTLKVGYHLEQLPWGRSRDKGIQKWYEKFRRQAYLYDYIVDSSLNNVTWLRERGFKAFWCALGYHSSFEVPHTQNAKLPIPVGFTGFLSTKSVGRREKIINYLDRKLVINNLRVNVFCSNFNDVVHSADIQLNLHNYKQESWESYRTLRLMCNRKFILTEPISDQHPFISGVHWVECKYEHMPTKILYFLNNPIERQRIADTGYEFIKEKYDFTTHLQRLIQEIRTT